MNPFSSRSRIVTSRMIFVALLTYVLFWRPPGFFKEADTIAGRPEDVRQGIGSAMTFLWIYVLWAALEHFRLSGLWPYGI